MRIYVDWADWWVGLYRGPNHLYICPLPCLVIRLDRHRPYPQTYPQTVRHRSKL